MQQAIYTSLNETINTLNTARHAAPRRTTLRRHLALKWDLYGVLTLLASTAAYGAFALAHTGL
jgi:hypothetical protein